VGHPGAAHARPVIGVAENQIRRDDAVRQDLLLVIDVVEQEIERGDPLDNAALDLPPFLGRQHPRDRIEGQDAVDCAVRRIEREGDAVIVERLFGGGGAPPEIRDRQMAEPLAQFGRRRAALHLAIEPLRVVAVEHEACHRVPVVLPR